MWVDPRRNMSTFDYYYALLKGGYYSRALGALLNLPMSFKNVVQAVDNWYDVVLNYPMLALRRKSVKIRLRDGSIREVHRRGDISKIVVDYFTRQALLRVRMFYKVDLSFLAKEHTFIETFHYEFYGDLNVEDRIVVDIGAYIGDTTIYFLLHGAKHVYAVEPNPAALKIAVENIRRLGLEGRVTFINAAVGDRIGEVTVNPDAKIEAGADINVLRSEGGVPIKVVTLKWLVTEYGIEDAVLKMDCEGCEYESILLEDSDVLRVFKEMVVEYHYGYRNLVNRLRRAGFKVRYTKPYYSYNPNASNPHMFVGLIYAVHKM